MIYYQKRYITKNDNQIYDPVYIKLLTKLNKSSYDIILIISVHFYNS